MLSVKLNYKKATKQALREKKQVERRFVATCRRELRRGGKRFAKALAKQTKDRTAVRLTQKELTSRYIKSRFHNSKDVNKMLFTVTAKRKGIPMIHFVRGKRKATVVGSIPIKKRKSPYVAIFKGRKVRVKRSFILKIKSLGEKLPYVFFRRGATKYSPIRSTSIINLLRKTGFDLDKQADRQSALIQKKVLKNEAWITEPLR